MVLATSYHADLFEPVLGDGSRWGLRISYVLEEEPLGTGGAIRNVAPALATDPDAPVVVLNGDVLSGHDLAAQLADFARPREGRPAEVSLHLVEVEDARAFGCVPTDEAGRVTDFVEKSDDPVTNQVNAGCYVFRRSVIDAIPVGRVVSVERETFPGLVAAGHVVVGFVETAYWRDVGTPAALVAASAELVRGEGSSPATPRVEGVGASAHWIAPDARVATTAVVDDGATVGAGARVDDDAVVSGSVVMPGAEVGAGALVRASVVGPRARVAPGVVLEAVTVGDDAVVTTDVPVEPGARIDCG